MSLLRDGIHRRAPLTARSGAGRSGAIRSGCVYGQDDTVSIEIKDQNLEGVGPFYVWTERNRAGILFGNLTQYISSTGICAFTLGISTTVSYGYSTNLILGADSTDYFNPAMLCDLILTCGSDEDVIFTPGNALGSSSREQNPDPFAPDGRLRQSRGN
jgi:hypothetical protein